jgi:hypothetical protein
MGKNASNRAVERLNLTHKIHRKIQPAGAQRGMYFSHTINHKLHKQRQVFKQQIRVVCVVRG